MKRQQVISKAKKKQLVFEMYIHSLKMFYKARAKQDKEMVLCYSYESEAYRDVLQDVFFVSDNDIEQAHYIAEQEAEKELEEQAKQYKE